MIKDWDAVAPATALMKPKKKSGKQADRKTTVMATKQSSSSRPEP